MAVQAIDPVTLLTDVDDHLAFAERILADTELPAAAADPIRRQVERVRQRRDDPCLYLAVVGEFSAGKSTFIDAVLRDPLLKRAPLVTTAAATHLRYGEHLDLEVQFAGTQRWLSYSETPDRIVEWVEALSVERVGAVTLRQLVDIVTSDERVAQSVTGVRITYPAPLLEGGVVIMDTPGLNAELTHHAEVTRKVVEEQADAAVVIVPATAALSSVLMGFLQESLEPYLHRCVFVVTKMDYIPEAEHGELLEYVRGRLVQETSLQEPMVLSASVGAVLDHLANGDRGSSATTPWMERFEDLELRVWERLRRERSLSVSENLMRLLRQLLEDLDGHLRERFVQLANDESGLRRAVIRDLDSFREELQQQSRRHLDEAVEEARRTMRARVRATGRALSGAVHADIKAAADDGALAQAAGPGARKHLDRQLANLHQGLGSLDRKLDKHLDEVRGTVDDRFAREYRRLERLTSNPAAKLKPLGRPDAWKAASKALLPAEAVGQLITKQENRGLKIGAGIGAAIGTLVAPGPGTAIGAGLGAAAAKLFGPNMDQKRERYWAQLGPSLDQAFEQLEAELVKGLDGRGRRARRLVDDHIDSYVDQYRAAVAKMTTEQAARQRHLRDLARRTEADLTELQRRRDRLAARRSRLARATTT